MRRLPITVLLAALTLASAAGLARTGRADAAVAWSAPQQIDGAPPFSHPADITDTLTCTSQPFCLGVAGGDRIVASLNPAGGAGAWTVTDLSRIPGFSNTALDEASCASAQWCAVANSSGQMLTSSDPSAPVPQWSASSLPPAIRQIACPAAGECIGIAPHRIWSTTQAAAGSSAWHSAALPRAPHPQITAELDCPSVHLCVVDAEETPGPRSPSERDWGAELLTSAAPTGGTRSWKLVREPNFDGPTPTFTGPEPALSCPSTRWCALKGPSGILTTRHPRGGAAAWSAAATKDTATNLACPSASFCLSRLTGTVIVSRNPSGGAGTWHTIKLPYGPVFSDIESSACASPALCVVGAPTSALFTSTTPAGASSSWRGTSLMLGSDSLQSVSCAPGLCLAADDDGHALVTQSPSSGVWDVQTAPAATSSFGTPSPALVSCAATNLCAFAVPGTLATTTDPAQGPWSTRAVPIDSDANSDSGGLTSLSCLPSGGCLVGDSLGGVTAVPADAGSSPVLTHLVTPGCYSGLHNTQTCGSDPIIVACASDTFCAATDSDDLWISTSPLQGDWSKSTITNPVGSYVTGPTALSCPSAGTCVIGFGDTVGVTTDATDQAPHWSFAHLPNLPSVISGLSCVSGTSCVAVDRSQGFAFAGDPATAAWTQVRLAPNAPDSVTQALTGVSCGLGDGCVAIDGTGHAAYGALS